MGDRAEDYVGTGDFGGRGGRVDADAGAEEEVY